MTLYEQFKKAKLDLTLLGLENGPARSDYFCTPIGAKVIGWAGVDGIHFCFIRGFDDMVFSVSPMNGYGDYVHPVARTFSDFLRLLLACGNTAAIEQAHGWNEEEFATFLAEDLPDAQQTAWSNFKIHLHFSQSNRLLRRSKRCRQSLITEPFASKKSISMGHPRSRWFPRHRSGKYTITVDSSVAVEENTVEPKFQWEKYFLGMMSCGIFLLCTLALPD